MSRLYTATGQRRVHEVATGYQNASRNAGRWDRRARVTAGQWALMAYMAGITTAALGYSIWSALL